MSPAEPAAAGRAAVPCPRAWRRLLRAPVLFLGAADAGAAAARHSMNADGTSYLDLGDALLRGDWHVALNSVWSPLYGWLLGAAQGLVQPSLRWELPLVHAVNLGVLALALACFETLWSALERERLERLGSEPGRIGLPPVAWWAAGHALFAWAALTQVKVWAVTPDLLMACFLFLAAACLVRIRRGGASPRTWLALGAVLGLGFLAKSPMLPIGLAFLAAAAVLALPGREALARLAMAAAVFAAIAGAWAGALSVAKGRLTWGDAGTITYARHVNGVPYPHWQGGDGHGTPLHPTRQVLDDPPVFEFAEPIGGTYPPSFDPSYWYEGVDTGLRWDRQLARLRESLASYGALCLRSQAVPIAAWVVLLLAGGLPTRSLGDRLRRRVLLLPSLGGLALYAPILVADRYVGALVVLAWADLLAPVRLRDAPRARRLASAAGWAAAGWLALHVLLFHAGGLAAYTGRPEAEPRAPAPVSPRWPGEVALALRDAGLRPGDPVGLVGYGFDSYWARLARVRIVAELPAAEAGPFWRDEPGVRERVVGAFARQGVRAVVAEGAPPDVRMDGWIRVGSSTTHLIALPRAAATSVDP